MIIEHEHSHWYIDHLGCLDGDIILFKLYKNVRVCSNLKSNLTAHNAKDELYIYRVYD